MKIVVDANVFFSALMRDGLTRRLLFHPDLLLFAPYFLLEEARAYRLMLLRKYKGPSGEFDELFDAVAGQIRFVSQADLAAFAPAAETLSSDSKDWAYLACALYCDAAIWTRDKEFQRQRRVKIYTTENLAQEAGLL